MKLNIGAIRLFVFDMDGVIFQGKNFWLDLHKAYGNEDEAYKFYGARKNENYHEAFVEMAKYFWKDIPTQKYFELVNSRQYSHGIDKLLAVLRQFQIKTAIISSGPLDLAERAARDLKIDYICANKLEISHGKFTGNATVKVDDHKKDIITKALINDLKIDRNRVVFIGDSASDVSVTKLIPISFAYDTNSKELLDSTVGEIKYGDLGKFAEQLWQRKKLLINRKINLTLPQVFSF